MRLVNPKDRTQRIILSPESCIKGQEHRWQSSVHRHSYDLIEEGDAVFVIYEKQMYVLLMQQIFFNEISYKIAEIAGSGSFPKQVDLKELPWREQEADEEEGIPVGSRRLTVDASTMPPVIKKDHTFSLSIVYDVYYAFLGGTGSYKYDPPTHIAIVHKPYLEKNSVVDLTKFRFKAWEDGLGNRCDSRVAEDEVKGVDWRAAAQGRLGEKDVEVLDKNGIVITNQAYKQVFEPYLEGTVPFFITSDSLLNAYHVLYEESVLRMEEANAKRLPDILRTIHQNLATVDKKWKGNALLLAAAKKRASIIIGTALRLVDESFRTGEKKIDAIIEEEVEKIVEARKKEMPVWLGKPDWTFLGLNYNRYKPRGFYTRSERLERHFRAVAWLQSIPFRVSKDEELVSIMMLGSCVPERPLIRYEIEIDEYRNLFRGYRLCIGSGDDWDLLTAAYEAGKVPGYDLNGDALSKLKEELAKKATRDGEGPQINDQLRFAPDDPNAAAEANFRIISAYRTPDGILFHRTTDLRQFDRDLPDGLEVCTALGSAFAREKLTYKDKARLLKTIDEAKSVFSGDSLYFGYLEQGKAS
jgi:hypothetical protein